MRENQENKPNHEIDAARERLSKEYPRLHNLVENIARPLWGGELEVCTAGLEGAARTDETTALFLKRQAYKEVWGSGVGDRKGLYLGPVEYLNNVFEEIDAGTDRHDVLDVIDGLRDEFSHYILFADVHDLLTGGKLTPKGLKNEGWEADNKITRMRFDMRQRYGQLGDLAVRFSEGGNSSLYVAGMRLSGKGEINDQIAAACKQVHDEEIGHMFHGLVGLGKETLTAGDWDKIDEMAKRLLTQRIRMRNEQFSFPIDSARMAALEAGMGKPMEFNYPALMEAIES